MAPFGLSTLRALWSRRANSGFWSAPAASWSRPFGLGWQQPYSADDTKDLDHGPWHGMPLGGFGAGCIGRNSRGEFNLWNLDAGEHWQGSIPDCQFALFERQGEQRRAHALATEPQTDDSFANSGKPLSTWNWYPPSTQQRSTGTYAARYPLSWTHYESVFAADLTCEAFSPILPGDYRRTSYPLAVFRFQLHNPTSQPLELSLLLSWRNTCGWFTSTTPSTRLESQDHGRPQNQYLPAFGAGEGQRNSWIDQPGLTGLLMEGERAEPLAEGQGQWCMAVPDDLPGVEIMRCSRWDPSGDGSELWDSFASDGRIANSNNDRHNRSGEQVSTALAVKLNLAAGERLEIPVVIAWDLPVMALGTGNRDLRRYTDFHRSDGQAAVALAAEGLRDWPRWREQIDAWQAPLLAREDLPEPLRMALFNELYDLASGGSLWTAARPADPVGRFGVLECFDTGCYESLDARLYGSFALLQLWPELDKSVLRRFSRAIDAENAEPREIGWHRSPSHEPRKTDRKKSSAIPHDLGAANKAPFEATSYDADQDCNSRKDLASDYVLQVWRTFLKAPTGEDLNFLAECWPATVLALRYLKQFDENNDGLPEHGANPAQTFEGLPLQGVSSYCGALWIAALEAALAMAQRLQLELGLETGNEQHQFSHWLEQSRANFDKLLWNGEHYKIDSENQTAVVMADQLCGDFYARLLRLPSVVIDERCTSTLNAVHEACFEKFNGDAIGITNSLRHDGKSLNSNKKCSLEVSIGINFCLAAYYRLMDKNIEAEEICLAVIKQIYEGGLQFRTPRSITTSGTFRAGHNLQAMAIWALWAAHTDWSPIPGASKLA
ncbi:MAG: bile acid beta-glucosidase [Prochlorococcus sp.]|nr:bile acid beta-glucosidase [Prochlorococcus sp.]